ncbi:serine/threonine-protein kinase [Paraburkholderia lycopersici]|uniref:Protein kinase domain-containing protein n=1 Tax=Paraburkholderia lycopersici TaxID=416944 RepID=A0A1G6M2N4_9BURK|nr:serine/threonine-protein kinase [Paraburkholderia lycopersici]SDC49226.1 Protein kinase domain-containing protein [Paraburkholderia lycopersici]
MASGPGRLREVGGWQLQERLGRGGNGEVYKAVKGDRVAAIKILHSGRWDDVRRARFRDEIDAMQRCQEFGCIPVIEFDVPAAGVPGQAWFAMDLAEPLVDALGDNPSLVDVVSCVRDIARVLVSIHARGIAHRDIKPDNLFRYKGRWTVGDFGLADFDGKLAKTREGEKIGPVFYIAPEMLNEAVSADGEPADCYSLAKTLWVLITGQKFPLPGPLLRNIDALKASTYHSDERAPLLDAVLESATRHTASARPTMEEFAQELDTWLMPTGPASNDGLDLSDFAAVFSVAKYQMEVEQMERNAEAARVNETGERIREKLRPHVERLVTALNTASLTGVHGTVDNYMWGGMVRAAVPRQSNSGGFVRLELAINGNYQDPQRATLGVVCSVRRDGEQSGTFWEKSVEFLPGGSGEDIQIERLFSEVAAQLRPAVTRAAELNQALG